MRVALAKVLLSQPTCLFLDEPTNHLDLESIMWLEDYIRNYCGSLVLISHDRAFVDRTCDRVLEIQGGSMTYYSLPYTKYEEEKAVRYEQVLKEYKKQQDEIEGLERFVERFKAKASKATQAQSKQRQLDKIERIELPATRGHHAAKFPEAPPTGPMGVRDRGPGQELRRQQGLRERQVRRPGRGEGRAGGPQRRRQDHLAQAHPGHRAAHHAAVITRGANVQTALLRPVRGAHPRGMRDGPRRPTWPRPIPASAPSRSAPCSAAMLFSADDAFKKFGVLSGGERARVRLSRMLLRDCNVLILDEPTNHLDMDSKHLLMQAIADFSGTVLFVSHDRHFVEKVATRVLLVKDGRVADYPGDYHTTCTSSTATRPHAVADSAPPKPENKGGSATPTARARPTRNARRKGQANQLQGR